MPHLGGGGRGYCPVFRSVNLSEKHLALDNTLIGLQSVCRMGYYIFYESNDETNETLESSLASTALCGGVAAAAVCPSRPVVVAAKSNGPTHNDDDFSCSLAL